jgi:hypothetical protein
MVVAISNVPVSGLESLTNILMGMRVSTRRRRGALTNFNLYGSSI